MSESNTINCSDCGAGAVEVTREFSHSPRAVTIGFLLLGLGISGLIAALIWYISLTSEVAAEQTPEQLVAEVRAALATAQLPAPLLEKISRGESLTPTELAPLPDAQRKAVATAWNRLNARHGKREAGHEVTGVAAFTIAIPCCAVFLVAFPLIARRRVRRCAACGNPPPA